MMLLLSLFVVLASIMNFSGAALPIRHVHIDLHEQSTFIINHPSHQIGLGDDSSNLLQCIYLCQNHDHCRTAVFDQQVMICLLFEECSTMGDSVLHGTRTLISFQLYDDKPVSMAFSPPLKVPIPVRV